MYQLEIRSLWSIRDYTYNVRIHPILLGIATGFVAAPFVLADVVPLTSLNLVGNGPGLSQITTNASNQTVLRLTPNFDTNPSSGPAPAAAAWTNRLDVAGGFTANFHFQFSDPCLTGLPTCVNDHGNGGDGIAFLIQNDAKNALGVGSGGMGFLGITDSVAIMLDTYQNSSPNFYGDPSNNYIAVNTRGTDFNAPHHDCTSVNGGPKELTADPSLHSDLTGSSFSPFCDANPTLAMTGGGPTFGNFAPLTTNMDDGQVHDLQVIYNPGGFMDIFLDSIQVLDLPINLQNTLALENGTDAFLGFTAGTRFAYQNQDILDFSVNLPEPAWSQFLVPLAALFAIVLTRRWRRVNS